MLRQFRRSPTLYGSALMPPFDKATVYRVATRLWDCGLPLPFHDNGDTVSIVCFHGVHSPDMARVGRPPSSSISAKAFEANVRGVLRSYEVISLTEALKMLSGRRQWRGRCAVLTFDDSLKCTATVAVPILETLGVTATVFVSTEAIETQTPYWWLRLDHGWYSGVARTVEAELPDNPIREFVTGDSTSLAMLKNSLRRSSSGVRDRIVARVLSQLETKLHSPSAQYPFAETISWNDLRQVASKGFEIGSHSVTHANLTTLSTHDVRHELTASKRTIEEQLNSPCVHFCYPYGLHNEAVRRLVAETGYAAAVTTAQPGRNTRGHGLFSLNRFATPTSPDKLPLLMSGFLDATKWLSSISPLS